MFISTVTQIIQNHFNSIYHAFLPAITFEKRGNSSFKNRLQILTLIFFQDLSMSFKQNLKLYQIILIP